MRCQTDVAVGSQRRFGDVHYEFAFAQVSDMTLRVTNGRNGSAVEGNADDAKEIADGIQYGRLSKMWGIMSCK